MKKFKLSWSLAISLFFCLAQIPHLLTAAEINSELFLAKMSLEQKVGQLFIVGFPQTRLDQKLSQHIQKNKFGSFLLFKRNLIHPKQILELNQSLSLLSQQTTGLIPVLAIDQEGGFVNRLPLRPPTPHAVSIGISNSPELSSSYGNEIGKILSALGFNMNLAPVLDLAHYRKKSFIGVRSFGADPQQVSALGSAYSSGLIKNFVVPTAKHFPGLGDSAQDPHLTSVIRQDSAKVLLERDLLPFKTFSQLEGEKAIMLSHMIYTHLDSQNTPASFSSEIIQRWLRQELAFDGVVITDDLHMKASTLSHTVSEGAIKALEAGVDMIMLSWSFSEQEKTVADVLQAYKEGRLSVSELDKKLLRILKMKNFMAKSAALPLNFSQASVFSLGLQNLDALLFKSKIDQLKDKIFIRPGQQICVYSSQNQILNEARSTLKAPLRTFQMHPELRVSTLEKSLRENSCRLNIVTIHNWGQAQMLVQLSDLARKNLMVVNLNSVAFLRDPTAFLARLEVLSPYAQTGKGLAQFLNERISTSLPEVQSPHGLAQSIDAPTQSPRRPSSLKPGFSLPR